MDKHDVYQYIEEELKLFMESKDREEECLKKETDLRRDRRKKFINLLEENEVYDYCVPSMAGFTEPKEYDAIKNELLILSARAPFINLGTVAHEELFQRKVSELVSLIELARDPI